MRALLAFAALPFVPIPLLAQTPQQVTYEITENRSHIVFNVAATGFTQARDGIIMIGELRPVGAQESGQDRSPTVPFPIKLENEGWELKASGAQNVLYFRGNRVVQGATEVQVQSTCEALAESGTVFLEAGRDGRQRGILEIEVRGTVLALACPG